MYLCEFMIFNTLLSVKYICKSKTITKFLLIFLMQLAFYSQAYALERVEISSAYPSGMIVIDPHTRRLYFTLGDYFALRYPVAVAKRGKEWAGIAHVNGKFLEPAWAPPQSVLRDHPELPDLIPGGSPHNPMGVAALTLDRAEIAIHGTTQAMRASIGTAASYGCIRMRNEDVEDLYSRVRIGTPVIMLP